MKNTRTLAALLAALLIATLTFTACGGNSNSTPATQTPASTPSMAPSSGETAPTVTPPDDAQILQDFIDNYSKEYDFSEVEVFGAYATDTGMTVEARFTGQELVYDREPYYLYLVNAELSYSGSNGNWTYNDMHESKREHRLSPFVLGLMEGYHEAEKGADYSGSHTSYTISNIAEDGSSFTITNFVWYTNVSRPRDPLTVEIAEIEMVAAEPRFGDISNEFIYYPSDFDDNRFSRLVSDATNGEYPRFFVRLTHILGNSNLDILCALEKSQPDGIRIMLVEN
ncbi:hypothetical protein LJC60_05660 [Ruminococcaceae bacterium OttesenSCG-928-D13]|nr:hypothetical protein [Ruminococcaceae bacterium OttesenSCG-928-D13]